MSGKVFSMYQVVIIGRANVGKSTLFNRLIGRKDNLVHNTPGVTRDRLERDLFWQMPGKNFAIRLVDTGGLGEGRFAAEIEEQVIEALKKANMILFMVNYQDGVLPGDLELFHSLKRKTYAPTKPQHAVTVVNKVDDPKHEDNIADFYTVMLDDLILVSSEHNRGVEDLKGLIMEHATPVEAEPEDLRIPKIALIGRPNVGKSTLMNTLLNEKRMIVSPIAGTTSDAVTFKVSFGDTQYELIDTAGIRRKDKTNQGVEVLSVVRTRQALESADVALFMLDGTQGVTDQDEKISGLIEQAGASIIVVVNKWDTHKGSGFTRTLAETHIREQMGHLHYAPIVYISAKHNQGLQQLPALIVKVLEERRLRVSTKELTDFIQKEAMEHNPAHAKFFYCHQVGSHPPSFVFHVNDPKKIHVTLERTLANSMRRMWGFTGTPIRLMCKEAERRSLPKRMKTA